MEILLTILYFLLFCFIIYKIKFFNDSIIPKHWFIVAFGVKLIFGILLTMIYTYYYTDRNTADIYKYFDDSKIMFDAFFTNTTDFFKMLFGVDNNTKYFDANYYRVMTYWYRPYNSNLFSDSHVIIRFNTLIRFFSFGYFNVHNVFINFISLLGFTALYKTFSNYISSKKLLFYIIFGVPSVIFWSSGLLKEGIIFFGLGFLCLYSFKIAQQFKWKYLLAIIPCLIIITYTKFYLLAVLFIPFTGYLINKKLNLKKVIYGYLIAMSFVLISSYILPLINSNYSVVAHLVDKQLSFTRYIAVVKTNSGFKLPPLSDAYSVLASTPNALFTTLLRPFVWESKSAFILVYAIENLFILAFIMLCFIFRKKHTSNKNIFWFNLIFSLILFILIGLTTPVFGSIVRYKIPGLVFLLIAFIMMLDVDKLKTKFKFLQKIL